MFLSQNKINVMPCLWTTRQMAADHQWSVDHRLRTAALDEHTDTQACALTHRHAHRGLVLSDSFSFCRSSFVLPWKILKIRFLVKTGTETCFFLEPSYNGMCFYGTASNGTCRIWCCQRMEHVPLDPSYEETDRKELLLVEPLYILNMFSWKHFLIATQTQRSITLVSTSTHYPPGKSPIHNIPTNTVIH